VESRVAYLLESRLRLSEARHNELDECLRFMHDGFRRHQSYPAYQCVQGNEFIHAIQITHYRLRINSGSLVDEVGVERFSLSNLPVQ